MNLLFILIYFNNKHKYYCKDWSKGLNETYIDNNKTIYSCSINIPKKKCLIDIFSKILDFSHLLHINCDKRKEKEKVLIKQISNLNKIDEVKKIGYPITIGKNEEIKGRPAMYANTLLYFVKNTLNQNKFLKYLIIISNIEKYI